MLTTLIAFGVLMRAEPPQEPERWLMKLAATSSPEARNTYRWSSETVVLPSVMYAVPDQYFFDGGQYRKMSDEEVVEYEFRVSVLKRKYNQVSGYMATLDLPMARLLIESMMRGNDMDFTVAIHLAEVAALERSYTEVIDILAPFVGRSSSERMFLLMAYAGAHSGQVFQGQREYCEWSLRKGSSYTSDMQTLAQSDKAISALALGKDSGYDAIASQYLMQTLNLEPANALANIVYGKILERNRSNNLALQKYQLASAYGNPKIKASADRHIKNLSQRMAWEAFLAGSGGG